MNRQEFSNLLHGFMQADKAESLRKQAAPMQPGMPVDPSMMGGMPPMDPSMMQEAPAEDQGQPQQPPQETLNIQAKGPEAIDAIKCMMGSSGMQPTQEEMMQQIPPEVMAQLQMQPKMASFRRSLGDFMRAERLDGVAKRASAAYRYGQARENVLGMIRQAVSR